MMKARLQHSFDGHRARDTFIFLHIFSLQHFNFLLLSDPMFPFSIFISLFSNRSSSRNFADVLENEIENVENVETVENYRNL